MKNYTFNKTDSGIFGKAFEMAIKDALKRKNADAVSPCGSADMRYNGLNYEIKQNGGTIKYGSNRYIKGSNRVIYAPFVSYSIIAENDTTITIAVNLADTDMYCVSRDALVSFLIDNGLAKRNASRDTINIQTGYNYKKADWHGRAGKRIAEWCYDNEIDDDIIGDILDNCD